MPPQIWDLICLQLRRLGRHTPVAITRSHGQERSGPNGRAKDLTACPLNSSVDVEVFRSLLDGRAWFKLKEHFCLETMAYNHCQTWLLRFWGSMKVLPWYPESWTMPALEQDKSNKLEQYKSEYEKRKQSFELKVQQRNAEVNELETDYREGEPGAVATYCEMVLERSEYPTVEEYPHLSSEYCKDAHFPQVFRVAYVPASNQLVIDYELPGVGIVPTVSEVKYVKTKDAVQSKTRKASEVKSLYQEVIAALTLRSIHEVLEADQSNLIEVVVFSGYVNTVDLTTGQDIQPYLISVRVIRDRFEELNLSRIDKQLCLKNLEAV